MKEQELTGKGSWIWLDGKDCSPDSYAAFRRKINISGKQKVFAAVSADSNFQLYVNGKAVPGNQFSDYPQEKTFTNFDITPYTAEGINTIAIAVYFCGEDSFCYRKGYPGLWAVIHDGENVTDATSEDWLTAPLPGFRSGDMIKFTLQLGFNSNFDARIPGACSWMMPDFDDSGWQHAADVTGLFGRTLSERPLPCLTDCGFAPAVPVQYGYLIRHDKSGTPSEQMWNDALQSKLFDEIISPELTGTYIQQFEVYSVTEKCVFMPDGSGLPFKFRKPDGGPANGYYIIIDTGRETAGFTGFKVRCSEGTVIDYALGEHLDSGRTRAKIANRHMSDRYICKEGINEFIMSLRRCAGRYLELHFTETRYPPEIIFAGVAEQLYPLEPQTAFSCPDRLRMQTNKIAVSTLVNCMHEHYEDCPWREQALYAYDSRNQALYGYYVWGNYRFAGVSFDLIGKSMRADGFLSITSPGNCPITIPMFSFAWVSEIYELYRHSGSLEHFRNNAQVMRQLLDHALGMRTSGGLYTPGNAEGIWNFAEWVEGLSSCTDEETAPYNIYLYEALMQADEMFEAAGIAAPGYAEKAAELGKLIEEKFYLPEYGCYASANGKDKTALLHEHTQALMLFNGLVPEHKAGRLLEEIIKGSFIKCSFSSMPFLIRALMRYGRKMQDYAEKRVSDAFDSLTLTGATTLWEFPPDALGESAASLCHGWSSLPVYFNKRYILGVELLEPGFKKFTVKPYCGTLSEASGEVPTPYGNIKVSWKKTDSGIDLDVSYPEGITYIK